MTGSQSASGSWATGHSDVCYSSLSPIIISIISISTLVVTHHPEPSAIYVSRCQSSIGTIQVLHLWRQAFVRQVYALQDLSRTLSVANVRISQWCLHFLIPWKQFHHIWTWKFWIAICESHTCKILVSYVKSLRASIIGYTWQTIVFIRFSGIWVC